MHTYIHRYIDITTTIVIAPGRPKPKSDQFCVSATHIHIGQALFSRAPNPEKGPQKAHNPEPKSLSKKALMQFITTWPGSSSAHSFMPDIF